MEINMTKSSDDSRELITIGYLRQAPIYSPRILAAVRSLNREYLDLLVAEMRSQGSAVTGFGAATLRQLNDASRQIRDTIAECPYVLFRLDVAGILIDGGDPRVRDAEIPHAAECYAVVAGGSWRAFLNTAWGYAWHLSHHSPLAARIVLGFTPAQVDRLATFEPSQLRDIVAATTRLPAPRWLSNPCFWEDLVTFACEQQPRCFDAARLLGMQLLAADFR